MTKDDYTEFIQQLSEALDGAQQGTGDNWTVESIDNAAAHFDRIVKLVEETSLDIATNNPNHQFLTDAKVIVNQQIPLEVDWKKSEATELVNTLKRLRTNLEHYGSPEARISSYVPTMNRIHELITEWEKSPYIESEVTNNLQMKNLLLAIKSLVRNISQDESNGTILAGQYLASIFNTLSGFPNEEIDNLGSFYEALISAIKELSATYQSKKAKEPNPFSLPGGLLLPSDIPDQQQ